MVLKLTKQPVSVDPGDLTEIVDYLPGWSLPSRFSVTWDDPALPLIVRVEVVADDGPPRCAGLHLSERPGSPVTTAAIRAIPVSGLLEYAIAYVVMPTENRGPVRSVQPFKSPEDFRRFRKLRRPAVERERWQLTPELLTEVVEVYRAAESAPVWAVANHFKRPRGTASRWIVQAREEGYFDEAKKGRTKGRRK